MIISNTFPWSDNWWIENQKAWFIIGGKNILCCFDMDRNECDTMVVIPSTYDAKFRSTAFCMKYRDDVFCFPISGTSIWVYSVKSGIFSEISIAVQNMTDLGMHDFWEHDGKIFVVSIGLRRIFEINAEKKRIENEYKIGQGECIARSVKAENAIYTLSGKFQRIYRFDLLTKETMTYELPQIGRKYNTICFDEAEFWLGGYQKEMCRWNKEENTIDIYTGFFNEDMDANKEPVSEKSEMPVFLYAITVGKYHWFIPFQINEIICVDRGCHKVYKLEIAEEMESKESILARRVFKSKYILEYVRENRFIGLFSIKNSQIVEIDTEKRKYRWCDYQFGDQSIEKCAKLIGTELYENYAWDRNIYRKIMKRDNNIQDKECEKVGVAIHREMNK